MLGSWLLFWFSCRPHEISFQPDVPSPLFSWGMETKSCPPASPLQTPQCCTERVVFLCLLQIPAPPPDVGACVWLIRRGWSSVCSSFPQPRSFARRDRQRSQELAAKAAQVPSPCLLHTRSLAPWCDPERSRATESSDKIQVREEDAGGAVMWHLHVYLPGIYSRSKKQNPNLRVIQEQQQVPET